MIRAIVLEDSPCCWAPHLQVETIGLLGKQKGTQPEVIGAV